MIHDDVYRRLCRARDYIHAMHAEPLTLDAIAGEARLSPFHFQRTFAKTFGESPHGYLTRVRLERAKALLMKENLPVTEVCFEVGFQSLGSFSSLFARQVGQTPSVYRREMSRIWRIPMLYTRLIVPACFLFARSEKPA
jgi:AraC-like DNA-binding protein